MKWLRRSDLLPLPTQSTPPTGSSQRDPKLSAVNNAVVEATGGSSETTEKSGIPKEIEAAISASLGTGKHRPKRGRQMSTTLASPIPAMLAESMGLALERDPPPVAGAPAGEMSPEAILVFGASAVRQVNDRGERRDNRPVGSPTAKNAPEVGPRTPHRR
jgi:hypothetical protein